MPAIDAPATTGTPSDLTVGYVTNDLVAKQTQTISGITNTRTFTLDPQRRQRLQTAVDGAGTRTSLNHYDSSADSPSWIATTNTVGSATGVSRNLSGLDGNLGLIQTSTTSGGTTTYATEVQLTNPHGDVTATVDDTTGATTSLTYGESTEYGTPRTSSTLNGRYTWLGGKQRSDDSLGNLTLMGVRLYSPVLGRFLQTDPIKGGSSNAYDYAGQDSINNFDLDGRRLDPGETYNGLHYPFTVCPRGYVSRHCSNAGIVSGAHRVVKFFSYRSDIDAGGDVVTGRFDRFGRDALGGVPNHAAAYSGKAATYYRARHSLRSGRHMAEESTARRVGRRWVGHVFGPEVGVPATTIDFLW